MPATQTTKLQLPHTFDRERCRHLVNSEVYVLHCHHYATLYSQLAEDCGMLDGKKLLAEVAEDTFYDELNKYFKNNNVNNVQDRISIAEQYYTRTGLGKMNVLCAGTDGAEVELQHSHVDEGWIKKWGKHDKPVNFITRGYIAGMLSSVFGKPRRSFAVVETQSIVKGDTCSRFQAASN